MSPELHINIDHIATVRQARKTVEPSPLEAVKLLESTKAAGITMHLREDRRHVNDEDIRAVDEYLRAGSKLGLTFEMGATEEIRSICLTTKAKLATLVPEKRSELTTEGGLDVLAQKPYLSEFIKPIKDNGTKISMFVDPVIEQVAASKEVGAAFVELHTGTYANLFIKYHADQAVVGSQYIADKKLALIDLVQPVQEEILRLKQAADFAHSIGLRVNLGHGLTIPNLPPLLEQITKAQELHIGHSIVANSLYYGLSSTIAKFLAALAAAA